MIGLIRNLFWFALFLVFTLGFVTLFEHGWRGTDGFVKDFQTEFDAAAKMVQGSIPGKTDPSNAGTR